MRSAAPCRAPIAKKTGFSHLVSAAGYSAAGLHYLFREAAFRQEILLGGALLAMFAVLGVPADAYIWQSIMLLLLAAAEAVNTAIELIVDRLSPDWSAFAKHAKDLGSFAVACLILANLAHAALVVAHSDLAVLLR
ncbi:diacylglycerol kinase [Mangrovicella endophytica]|uniref:diacylglycerol kinase n=1 Tax=Mangrovicella endophytica TaxID=2066697 RepID=UPI000C9DFC46|nr:diacylglycerol kinase [Mangrovicella endophytica]